MSTLSDFRNGYYSATSKVSDNIRSLALSAVAIVWVFKINTLDGSLIKIPHELYWALLFAFCALAVDLVQYVYTSLVLGIFCYRKEKIGTKDDDVITINEKMNWPTIIIFYLKVFVIIFSYANIFIFFSHKLVISE